MLVNRGSDSRSILLRDMLLLPTKREHLTRQTIIDYSYNFFFFFLENDDSDCMLLLLDISYLDFFFCFGMIT